MQIRQIYIITLHDLFCFCEPPRCWMGLGSSPSEHHMFNSANLLASEKSPGIWPDTLKHIFTTIDVSMPEFCRNPESVEDPQTVKLREKFCFHLSTDESF